MSNVVPLFPAARARAQATPSVFKDFEEVCEWTIADPDWVSGDESECTYSAEDEAALRAFFGWFGVPVGVGQAPRALAAAWAWLGGEFGAAAGWRRDYPATFKSQCGDWPPAKLEYLDALMAGDHARARALVERAGVLGHLRELTGGLV